MKLRNWRCVSLGLAGWGAALAACGQAAGGSYWLNGQVTGGGATSQGGSYILRGTVAPLVAGRSVSVIEPGVEPTDFRVIGGWLGPIGSPASVRPSMRVRFTADKLAELSWDLDISGYVLEFSDSIGPAENWQPVSPQPSGTSFTTPCRQPARFFR